MDQKSANGYRGWLIPKSIEVAWSEAPMFPDKPFLPRELSNSGPPANFLLKLEGLFRAFTFVFFNEFPQMRVVFDVDDLGGSKGNASLWHDSFGPYGVIRLCPKHLHERPLLDTLGTFVHEMCHVYELKHFAHEDPHGTIWRCLMQWCGLEPIPVPEYNASTHKIVEGGRFLPVAADVMATMNNRLHNPGICAQHVTKYLDESPCERAYSVPFLFNVKKQNVR